MSNLTANGAGTELPALRQPASSSVIYVAQLTGLGLAACAVSCLFFFPRIGLWRGLSAGVSPFIDVPEVNRAVYALQQLAHPWSKIRNSSNVVLQWRLFFPILGHALSMPPWLYLSLPHVGCVVVAGYAAHLMRRRGAGWWTAFFAATLLATGSWFFVATGWLGYTDSWTLLGMLAVAFSPWRTTIAITCLLEPFIDERFVMALPLAYVIRQIDLERVDRQGVGAALLDAALMAGPSIAYILVRMWMIRSEDTGSILYVQQRLGELRNAATPWYIWVDGWWQGLRCGWVLVALAIWLEVRRRPAAGWVLAIVCAVTLAAALLIAADIGRSASALWPAAMLGLLLALRQRSAWVRNGLPVLVVANLILPASNVLIGTIRPISWFGTELDRYRHPTGILNPAGWLEAANLSISQKQWNEALGEMDICVKLGGASAKALADRAIIYLNLNDLERATVDADAATAINPVSVDALFARGMIYQRQHDTADARRLLERALNTSGPDWQFRADCIAGLKSTQQ
jgi:Holliday junction resolvase-like predicted endonuclease